jgi:hypothetical protein
MSATAVNLAQLASHWRQARSLYPLYAALVRQFDLGIAPCRELESPINRSEPDVIERVHLWFDQVDEKLEVWQLRQLLQSSEVVNRDNLHLLTLRHVRKPEKTDRLRDKLDYLLVQYFAHCAPHDAQDSRPSLEQVADVLHPFVGELTSFTTGFEERIEKLIAQMDSCSSFADLMQKNVLEQGRALKVEAGERYFLPAFLVAFARFNFTQRFGFFRLMHADLHVVRQLLHEFESKGRKTADCSLAGLGTAEPLANVRALCHDWKKPFRAAYSAGSNFRQLMQIRAALEAARRMPEPAIAQPAPVSAAPVPTVVQPVPAPDVEACILQMAEQLLKAPPAASAKSSFVTISGFRVPLASWEVAAFTAGGDDLADALQHAVAVRLILTLALEKKKKGDTSELPGVISLAHAEAALMQERVARAKDARNIDAAVNLAATAKRLLALIEQAEKQS